MRCCWSVFNRMRAADPPSDYATCGAPQMPRHFSAQAIPVSGGLTIRWTLPVICKVVRFVEPQTASAARIFHQKFASTLLVVRYSRAIVPPPCTAGQSSIDVIEMRYTVESNGGFGRKGIAWQGQSHAIEYSVLRITVMNSPLRSIVLGLCHA